MTEYKSGDIAFYHEMGEVLKVRILENKSNQKEETYKLKVLQVIQESSIVKPSKVGEKFECWASKKVGQSGWFLGDS